MGNGSMLSQTIRPRDPGDDPTARPALQHPHPLEEGVVDLQIEMIGELIASARFPALRTC